MKRLLVFIVAAFALSSGSARHCLADSIIPKVGDVRVACVTGKFSPDEIEPELSGVPSIVEDAQAEKIFSVTQPGSDNVWGMKCVGSWVFTGCTAEKLPAVPLPDGTKPPGIFEPAFLNSYAVYPAFDVRDNGCYSVSKHIWSETDLHVTCCKLVQVK